MDKILAMIGPIVKLINQILELFRKSAAEKGQEILKKNDQSKDDFKKTGRPK